MKRKVAMAMVAAMAVGSLAVPVMAEDGAEGGKIGISMPTQSLERWNRRCEELADLSERGGVISSYLGLTDYNQKAINRSWKRFIAHQFHCL